VAAIAYPCASPGASPFAPPGLHDRREATTADEPYLVPDACPRRTRRSPRRSTGRSTTPVTVFWRRRLVAVLAAGVGLWLAVAAFGGLTTALRGLGSRPLVTPELAGAGQPPTPGRPHATPVAFHVVQPGETLWGIARRLQPSGDIRPLVDRLAAAHGRGPLVAGESLAVP
jgi:hypothetical protein